MTQIEFDRLVEEVEQAFEKSEIKKHVENAGKNPWHYDICTRIVPQRVLVVGFNPGVKQNYDHERQNQFPDKTFMESLSDQGSMCRVGKYLEKYFSQHIKEIGQTNYCFFRSETAGQIQRSDLQLCLPIFLRLLEIAKPCVILSFSSRTKKDLEKSPLLDLTENHCYKLPRGNLEAEYCSAKGFISVESQKTPIYFLPHPQYHISGDIRKRIWCDWFGERK